MPAAVPKASLRSVGIFASAATPALAGGVRTVSVRSIWMLVPVVAALRGIGRVWFLIAVGVSVVIEGIGAFSYSGSIDLPMKLRVGKMHPRSLL